MNYLVAATQATAALATELGILAGQAAPRNPLMSGDLTYLGHPPGSPTYNQAVTLRAVRTAFKKSFIDWNRCSGSGRRLAVISSPSASRPWSTTKTSPRSAAR